MKEFHNSRVKRLVSIVITIALCTISFTCATTQSTSQNKESAYPNITFKNVRQSCQDVKDGWMIPVAGTTVSVLQFSNCLEIDNLLMIAVDNSLDNNIKLKTVELVILHFAEFLKKDSDVIWTRKKIKTNIDNGAFVTFYILESKKKLCTDGPCRLEE